MCAVYLRLHKADEALEKLQADRTIWVHIAEGRARLEALLAEAYQEMAAPPQPFGEPVGTEEVRRLQQLIENLHSQVSSLQARKDDQWRGVEELWELRRENDQLRRFRDEHPASVCAIQPLSDKKCDSIEEAGQTKMGVGYCRRSRIHRDRLCQIWSQRRQSGSGKPQTTQIGSVGVSQQSMVSDPNGIDATLLDALEEDLQETQVSDDVRVLKFDLTQADSVSSSSSESAVPRRRRHGNRFSVFMEESEEEGLVLIEVDPSSMKPSRPVAGFDRHPEEGSSHASLDDTESSRSGVSSASSEADDHADDEPTHLPITGFLTSQVGGLGLVSLDEVILEDVQRESPFDGDSSEIFSVEHAVQL